MDRVPDSKEDAFDDSLFPPADVGAVVIGFNAFFNYRLISYAHHVLFRQPDTLFVATNMVCMPHCIT